MTKTEISVNMEARFQKKQNVNHNIFFLREMKSEFWEINSVTSYKNSSAWYKLASLRKEVN